LFHQRDKILPHTFCRDYAEHSNTGISVGSIGSMRVFVPPGLQVLQQFVFSPDILRELQRETSGRVCPQIEQAQIPNGVPCKDGKYLLVLSDKERLPQSCAYDARVAVKVLLMDPSSKRVPSVTAFFVSLDAKP
jgi:hypothetical protein